MKFVAATLVGALMLAAPVGSVGAKSTRPGIAWSSSLQSALKEARRTGKPLMVDFWATWCAPCHAMEERTFSNASVIKQSRRWITVRVNIESQPEVAERFGLETPPLLVFLKPNGALSSQLKGFAEAPKLLKHMKAAYAKALRK